MSTELGDLVHDALSTVGLTQERVSRWLGRPCGCRERQEKLNALSSWARRVISGKVTRAREYLGSLIGDPDMNEIIEGDDERV